MTPTRDFRVALVGCGRISRNHVEALGHVDGLTLSAVCDVDADRARTVGEAQACRGSRRTRRC